MRHLPIPIREMKIIPKIALAIALLLLAIAFALNCGGAYFLRCLGREEVVPAPTFWEAVWYCFPCVVWWYGASLVVAIASGVALIRSNKIRQLREQSPAGDVVKAAPEE